MTMKFIVPVIVSFVLVVLGVGLTSTTAPTPRDMVVAREAKRDVDVGRIADALEMIALQIEAKTFASMDADRHDDHSACPCQSNIQDMTRQCRMVMFATGDE